MTLGPRASSLTRSSSCFKLLSSAEAIGAMSCRSLAYVRPLSGVYATSTRSRSLGHLAKVGTEFDLKQGTLTEVQAMDHGT